MSRISINYGFHNNKKCAKTFWNLCACSNELHSHFGAVSLRHNVYQVHDRGSYDRDHIKIASWKINFLQNNKRSRRNPIWLLDIYEIYFLPPPQIPVGHPLVCIVIDSMPEIACRFIYAGLIFSLLSITLHHPNHISHYCLLSIAAASPIPPKWAPDIAYMSKCIL